MKTALTTLLITFTLATSASAQTKPDPHAGHGAMHGKSQAAAPGATTAAMTSEMTEGEVRRVDKEGAKVTLRHGELKGLDMPPMTMVFNVRDKAALDGLKAGDKVRFKVVSEGGKLTVTDLAPVK